MRIWELLAERMVDPAQLAQRVATRYGNQPPRYKHWDQPVRNQNIPMRSFNSRTAERVSNIYGDLRFKIAKMVNRDHRDPEVSAMIDHFFVPQTFDINALQATQPFVRIDDRDQLGQKLATNTPANIRVAIYRGVPYIMDGHHAVMAAALRGDRTVPTNVIDLDQAKMNISQLSPA